MNPKQRYYSRKDGKTSLGRKRKRALVALGVTLVTTLVILVIFAVHNALGRSDFFQITDIKINGCEKVSKRQVLEYSGVDIHSNLFSLNTNEVRRNVEAGPWIRQAEVAKNWPNRLDISVKEYSPVAMVNLEGSLHYVDKFGNVFAEAVLRGDFDYPVVTGLSVIEPEGLSQNKVLMDGLRFIEYASRGNLNLPAQNISEINVIDPGNVVLFLVDRPFPIHLGPIEKDLKTKYSRLVRILSWLYRKKKIASTEYIRIGHMNEKILVGQRAL